MTTPLLSFVILLVEDSEADQRLVERAFKAVRSPHDLYCVRHGEAALDFLARRNGHENSPRPQLILLDWRLPLMSGLDVLAHIKTEQHLMHIPILVLSSSTDPKDIATSYQMGANAYVSKPDDLASYEILAAAIAQFWFEQAQLPRS